MIEEYFEALDRLIKNNPINVKKGTKINKDTVALEAGKKRGSIKKSRQVFSLLIEKIDTLQDKQNFPINNLKIQKSKYKNEAEAYRKKYEDSLNRELMYIEKINKLEKLLK